MFVFRTSIAFSLLLALLAGCAGASDPQPNAGGETTADEVAPPPRQWAGTLALPVPLKIRMETTSGADGSLKAVVFRNAEEEIKVDDIAQDGDSTVIAFPVFESALHVVVDGKEMRGIWHNDARTRLNRIPFEAQEVKEQDVVADQAAPLFDISGKWEVEFVYEGEEKTPAIGYFEQTGSHLTGTFQTETGDYRFLEGSVNGPDVYLSCFDGAHAFVFTATIADENVLTGDFYSGLHWHETWTARRNPDFALSDPDSLTKMAPGETTLDFSFLNTDRKAISPTDPQFDGKALVVQIMGTWCPNCKDETPFLNELYQKYHGEGLEMISIGFEMSTDTARSLENLRKLKNYFEMDYDVVFGGKAGRRTASAAMPQLEHVMSYPTTIFMDRNHRVQRIYTGFSGPAVKGTYEKLTASFEETVRQLLQSS